MRSRRMRSRRMRSRRMGVSDEEVSDEESEESREGCRNRCKVTRHEEPPVCVQHVRVMR